MDLEARMLAVGKRYTRARANAAEAFRAAHDLALEAIDAEMSQHHVARLLGIDRMTIRKWLGER